MTYRLNLPMAFIYHVDFMQIEIRLLGCIIRFSGRGLFQLQVVKNESEMPVSLGLTPSEGKFMRNNWFILPSAGGQQFITI